MRKKESENQQALHRRRERDIFFEKCLLSGREFALSLLFPRRCPVCDEILPQQDTAKKIHPSCEVKLIPISGAVCMHCGRPFRKLLRKDSRQSSDIYMDNSNKEFCIECQKQGYVSWQETSSIRMGKALYLYRGAIKESMYRFKYANKQEYATFFAQRAVEIYPNFILACDVIVPVPMYRKKQKKRGYNQAECFARALSLRTGIPMEEKLVQRIRDTVPQKGLNDIERKNNLKNAFQIGKSIVKYNKILLVDDIYTTGSTVETVAKALKHMGIWQIYVLTICIGEDI